MNYIKMNKNPKIVIIGAGAAGVSAATKLYESGFTNITILEAENRIGGRIHSVEFGGSIVDLGGQWVHGENGNLVYDMVKNLDLLSPSYNTYEDMTFYLPDGSVMDKTITNRLFKIGENLIFDESSKDEPGTFGNFFVKRYNEEVLMEFRSNKDILRIANQIQEWFKKFFLCFEAAKSWHDISVKGVFCYTPCDGDQQLNWRNKGFKTIFDVLMRKIPDNKNQIPLEDKILMNKEVNSIIWEDNGSSQSDITITCSDGSVYTADHVIITVSVGVLKENHKKWFRPELPPYKINSIEHITLGNVSKIFLKFPQKWWPNEVKGFSLIWTEEAKVNLKNEVANLEPTINGISWLENVFGFYVIDSHPNVLLGWVTGELSSEVEHLSDEIVMSNCMYLLRKFVGNKYDISEPDEILRSKWSSNPHFCGTYTFSSIEAEQFNAKTEDLACPVSSKNKNSAILFAGESTHSKYYSTVHGAIESGYREANRLIDLYKTPQYAEVVIIGAGMAGLGAAWNLTTHGFSDFLIIEATDRAGGRIKTVKIDEYILDLGAQWIHGKFNSLYEIASSYNLLSEDETVEGSGIFIRNDGHIADKFLVKKVDWEVGEILEKCRSFVNEPSHPKSVKEFLDKEFEKCLVKYSDQDQDLVLQLYDWHIRYQTIDNSCTDLDTVSAKYWGTYVCSDEIAYYNLKNGYQSLIDILFEQIPSKHFVFNSPVTSISLNDRLITIECNNGSKITCKHIILTPSLGVLKEFKNICSLLPESLKNGIRNMGFYGIGKIFLIFQNSWWDNLQGFQFLWTSEDGLEQSEKWFRYITGFEPLSRHSNILMGFIGGEGVAIMEEMNEEEVGRVCIKQLRRFLKQLMIPEPIKVIRTKWLTDEWTRGSYSNISSKCDSINFGPNQLAQPILINGIPKIVLAGEAVHRSSYSTTHGAFESGQKQSNVLLEYIRSKNMNKV